LLTKLTIIKKKLKPIKVEEGGGRESRINYGMVVVLVILIALRAKKK